jgi:hypothetical protein
MDSIETLVQRASENGGALRLHTRAGEVIVARVLHAGDGRVRCLVLRSSRPENYARCDSTGLELALEDITRASPVRTPS